MSIPNMPVAGTNVLPIDFTKRRRSFESIGDGVYKDPSSGHFYWRPYYDGKQHWAKLDSTTPRFAKIERGKLAADLALSKKGLAPNPFAKTKSVAELCDIYLSAGCPGKNISRKRSGQMLKREIGRVEKIKTWPGSKMSAGKLSLEQCRNYHAWRKQSIFRRSENDLDPARGDRQVDLELVTLSNIYRHAMRNTSKTGIQVNPIAEERERFRDPSKVVHCRDHQPANAEELHAIARYLFDSPKSEVLGWQALFEAFVGQRSHEILKLRIDAKTKDEAGFAQGNHLWLYRSQSSKGTFPYAIIHSALSQCLAAFRNWHSLRFPKSPWYFPSPVDPAEPVGSTALTHALRRITPAMGIPHRTSHGLRSYFVNVLRSDGKADAEIALRIGQKTGGKLVVDVYGEILPYKLTWLPEKDSPAWSKWIPAGKASAPAAPLTQDEFGFEV